jgi:hypothetical protein
MCIECQKYAGLKPRLDESWIHYFQLGLTNQSFQIFNFYHCGTHQNFQECLLDSSRTLTSDWLVDVSDDWCITSALWSIFNSYVLITFEIILFSSYLVKKFSNFQFLPLWNTPKFSGMSSGLIKLNCYKYSWTNILQF